MTEPTTDPGDDSSHWPARSRDDRERWIGRMAAVLSAVTGAVHLGYAPHHLSEDWAHGWFFLVIGAVQIAAAMALMIDRRRRVWITIAVVDLLIIVVWVVSRTVGLPVGPESLRTEDVSAADLLCTVLEIGVVVLAAIALFARELLDRPVRDRLSARATVVIVSVVAVALGAVVLTPSFTDSHGATHDHTAVATSGDSPCELAGPPLSDGQVVTDADGHSHRGPAPQSTLTADERTLLEQQQTAARAAAARYPTVADAEAAGFRMSVAYVPCIGAHYTNPLFAISFDPAHPSELLFDGTTPDSRIVGLSYLVWSRGGAPEGFAGPNDVWHQHNDNGGLCQRRGVVIGAESMSSDECTALGGRKIALNDVWMLHDWVVPGWECSWGVFAGECPELGGRTGASAWAEPSPDSVAALSDRAAN